MFWFWDVKRQQNRLNWQFICTQRFFISCRSEKIINWSSSFPDFHPSGCHLWDWHQNSDMQENASERWLPAVANPRKFIPGGPGCCGQLLWTWTGTSGQHLDINCATRCGSEIMQIIRTLFTLLVLLTHSFSCRIPQESTSAQSLNSDAFLSTQCSTMASLDGRWQGELTLTSTP